MHRANLASASPPSTKASNAYRHLYKAIFSDRGHLGCDAISAFAAPKSTTATLPAFPGTLANAQYVYVAAYDGDQFDTNLLPEDREAISSVQNAIQTWGKLTLVYQPYQADIIILVTTRPSEDVMAVYDGHQGTKGNYLWRVMGRDDPASGETPLVTQFEKGFDSAQKHK